MQAKNVNFDVVMHSQSGSRRIAQVVYEDYRMVQLTLPYMSGFLAFREVPFLVQLLEHVKTARPEVMPQLLMVDGNGILHPRSHS